MPGKKGGKDERGGRGEGDEKKLMAAIRCLLLGKKGVWYRVKKSPDRAAAAAALRVFSNILRQNTTVTRADICGS